MARRHKVTTAARLDTVGVLSSFRPRTALWTIAAMVDGAAVLVEAGQPDDTVRLMFAGARLTTDQEDRLLAVLHTQPTPPEVG